MFTIISFSQILACYVLNVLVDNKYGDIFGEFVVPFGIVLSWCLSGKLVEHIDAKLPMKKGDKNFGYLLSFNSVILFAIILSVKETDVEYLHIASLSFAILIEAYIPIDIYFSTERIVPQKERLKYVFSNFQAGKRTVILYSATSILI